MLAKESTVQVCLIVLYLFFEPSLTFGLLEQEQWKPTTKTSIKLTRMGMMLDDYGSSDTEEEEQGLVEQDEENEQEDQWHDHMFVSPIVSGDTDLPDHE